MSRPVETLMGEEAIPNVVDLEETLLPEDPTPSPPASPRKDASFVVPHDVSEEDVILALKALADEDLPADALLAPLPGEDPPSTTTITTTTVTTFNTPDLDDEDPLLDPREDDLDEGYIETSNLDVQVRCKNKKIHFTKYPKA